MILDSTKKRIKRLLKRVVRPYINFVNHNDEQILRKVERLMAISNQHQVTFKNFKGIYTGKNVVMVGAGPTAKDFKPIPECIYIGLNSACKLQSVKYDYLFAIDKVGIDKIYRDFASVDCVKFIGDQNFGPKFQIPESEIFKMGDVRRYMTDAGIYSNSKCALHIESQPLGNYNSVSLQAMQFILYTNPKRIYLVGIDCSSLGHFNDDQGAVNELKGRVKDRNEDLDRWAVETVKAWKELKEFAETYYPETEIVSVNPVGLKGFFKDMYQ